MSKTSSIIEIMQDYISGSSNNEPKDPNHWVRRFYRCWIDGSYKGEAHYTNNREYTRTNYQKPNKMRTFVISEFTTFISVEFDCNYSTAQRAIVKSISKKSLEELTHSLIDDTIETFIND